MALRVLGLGGAYRSVVALTCLLCSAGTGAGTGSSPHSPVSASGALRSTDPLVSMGPCSAANAGGPVCAHVVRCPTEGWYALGGRCYQACPSNAQHRDDTGRCLCGEAAPPNVNCSAGLHCGPDHRCGGPAPTVHTVQLGSKPSHCNDCSPKSSCGWPEFEFNQIRDIGDHSTPPDGVSEFAVPFCQGNNPALAVVDVASLKVVGLARSPVESNRTGGVVLYPSDGEKIFPVLAPGYGEGTVSCGDPAGHCGLMWYFLCAYTPNVAAHPTTNCTTFGSTVAARCHCGDHFAAVSILPDVKPWGNSPELLPTAQTPIHPGLGLFREDGGYASHVDTDGVEDVTLIWEWFQVTISISKLRHLATVQVDPALNDLTCNGTCKGNESAGVCWSFHSGRQYGTHAASETPDGYSQTAIVAGSPVGSFSDWFCNVSRYLALLRSLLSNPGARELAWSVYTGFHSTYFTKIDAAFADNPWPVVGRLGNWANGCIHRFSDSRVTINYQPSPGSPQQLPVLAYNYFRQLRPISDCLQEQYLLYLPPAWTDVKQKAWGDCAVKNLAAPGWWEVHAREEATGKLVFNRSSLYMWGWSSRMIPTGGDPEVLYLMEDFGHEADGRQQSPAYAFDLRDFNRSKVVGASRQYTTRLSLHALSTDKKGAVVLVHRGDLPVAARPLAVMVDTMTSTNRTTADGSGFSELITRPNADSDADDQLVDIQMSEWENPPCSNCPKIWVGWSEGAGSLVVKLKTDDSVETEIAGSTRRR